MTCGILICGHMSALISEEAVRRDCYVWCFFFQAEDGIRDLVRSRGLGDVYKRQVEGRGFSAQVEFAARQHELLPHALRERREHVPLLSLIHI